MRKHTVHGLQCQDDVLPYRQITYDTCQLSILRAEGNTILHGSHRICQLFRLAVYFQLAACYILQAKEHLRRLRTTGAQEPGKADNLALVDLQGDILYLPDAGSVVSLNKHFL